MNLYVLILAPSKYTSKETGNNNELVVTVQSQHPERCPGTGKHLLVSRGKQRPLENSQEFLSPWWEDIYFCSK